MRRIIQSTGVEVIHSLTKKCRRSSEYSNPRRCKCYCHNFLSGGHNEYFKYMYDLLQEKANQDFGGGGGVILPSEIAELQAYGITRIYAPDDGRAMGLQGMINDLVQSDFPTGDK
jgi:methylmalonyl-CoA mutase